MDLSPGTTLSHYRIISGIGRGGMGEVYLAEDTKLDRKVALKILPRALAIDDDLMRRFVQEAKAASALNHPNIITIHEIGDIGDEHYIASEFIDGETLRTRLRRSQYLKGHYHASKYTKEGFNKGIEYFEQAIGKDPNFALAYSGLSYCYMNQTDWVFAPKESVPKARKAVESALRIDESLAEAHTMNAMLLLQYDWNWLAAEREFRRAIELDPNYALGRSFLAWHLAAMGRFEESIAEDRRALDLDPLSSAVNADLGWDLYLARRYEEGIKQLKKAIDLEPNYWVSHVLLGRCYEQTGRPNEAALANGD